MYFFRRIPPPTPVMPPMQGLGALTSKAWLQPAKTTPIPRRRVAWPRYPAKDPWVTDELVRWYAAQVNAGTYNPESYNPQQTAILAQWARRRGYIHSEMATRHLWREQRHASPRIRYLAPYSQITGDRNIPPLTYPLRKPARETIQQEPSRIKQVGRFLYRQVGTSWSRIQTRRSQGITPILTQWRGGTRFLQRRYDPVQLRRQVQMQKIQRERDRSFRARAQQIRATQLRTQ